MELHHRAVIRAWNKGDTFVRSTHDTGFPYGTKWQDSPKVMALVKQLSERYDVVKVDVRDAGG